VSIAPPPALLADRAGEFITTPFRYVNRRRQPLPHFLPADCPLGGYSLPTSLFGGQAVSARTHLESGRSFSSPSRADRSFLFFERGPLLCRNALAVPLAKVILWAPSLGFTECRGVSRYENIFQAVFVGAFTPVFLSQAPPPPPPPPSRRPKIALGRFNEKTKIPLLAGCFFVPRRSHAMSESS